MCKHFWKVSGNLFCKLLIAKVFGFILSCTILLALSGVVGSIVTQFCAVMLIIVLLFTTAWEFGSKDANMVAIGQIVRDPWLGLKAGLIASLPDIILSVLLLFTKAGIVGSYFTVIFSITNSNYLPFQQALLPQTLTVAEHSWIGYILSASTVLIAPLCSTFGYRLGLTQHTLSDILLYTTPEAKQQHALRLKERRGKRRFFR